MAPKQNFSLSVSMFPEQLHGILQEIDDEGNGELELDELTEVFTMYADMKKAAKEGSIAISTLPKEIQPTLKVFDVDGDGTVAPMELGRAAELYKESKDMIKKLTKLAGALLLMMGLLLGCIAGLTFGVVEASKETKTEPSGIQMVKGTNQPISSGSAVAKSSIFDASAMSTDALGDITSLKFSTGGKTHGYTITGYTKEADKVIFHAARGDEVHVTAASLTVMDAEGNIVHSERNMAGRRRELLAEAEVAATSIAMEAAR